MSNESQEFKLLITGDASSAVGAMQQTADATGNLTKGIASQGDEAKKAAGALEGHADSTKKLGEEIGKTGEKAEGGGREMRHLLNSVGSMAGVADAGALSMGKMGIAVFAVGAAIEFLAKTYEDIQDAIKGPIKFEVKDDAAQIRAVADAWNEYAQARHKVVEAANTPEAAEQREVKALAGKLKLLQDILKVEEQEALAALATHKDQMSPEAYAAAQTSLKTSFGAQGTAAEEANKQAEIGAQKKEADALAQKSAEDLAKGLAIAKAGGAQGEAIDNAASAKESLKEITEAIELIKRLQNPDNAEYSGLGGAGKKIEDFWLFFKRYGYTFQGAGPLAQEELRKTQAEAQINLGAFADDQKKHGAELITKAGQESGQAEVLKQAIKDAITELNAENQNTHATQAIGAATTALGRDQAAEDNNTLQGTRDALAAQRAGATAAAQLLAALQNSGSATKEAHDAMLKALNDLWTEQRKLAARIRNMPGNSK